MASNLPTSARLWKALRTVAGTAVSRQRWCHQAIYTFPGFLVTNSQPCERQEGLNPVSCPLRLWFGPEAGVPVAASGSQVYKVPQHFTHPLPRTRGSVTY